MRPSSLWLAAKPVCCPYVSISWLFLLLLAGCSRSGTNDGSASRNPKAVHDEIFTILREDSPNIERRKIESLVQSIGSSFEEVAVTVDREPLRWSKVILFKDHRQVDAVRFRSPLQVPGDVRLMMVLPKNWSRTAPPLIVSSSGAMGSTSEFSVEEKELFLDVKQTEIDYNNTCLLQSLDGGVIQPGKEYLLLKWHFDSGRNKEGVLVHCAVRLAPAG